MHISIKRVIKTLLIVIVLSSFVPTFAFAAIKGDVNGNGVVNIVDSQIAYDVACGKYTNTPNYAELKAAANVNGDNAVDAADAQAIQYYVHRGTFAVPKVALTIDSYTVGDSTIAVSFTYTNMCDGDSSASLDYGFEAHQDGYALSTTRRAGDYSTKVSPGYQTHFTVEWKTRTRGDVTVRATPFSWANAPVVAEETLRFS